MSENNEGTLKRDRLLLDLMIHAYDEDGSRNELIDSKNCQMIVLCGMMLTLQATLFTEVLVNHILTNEILFSVSNECFQKKYSERLSLEEALTKHNTSLKEIFKSVNKYPVERKQRTPRTKEWKYIQYTKNHTYRILKGKHRVCYGTYKTFEDAKKVREELIKCDWDKSQLDKILIRNNIIVQKNHRR